jgi:hypothetical protein
MQSRDHKFLEQKLVKLNLRYEELYFELLDHIYCKYEDSGIDGIELFWQKEKLSWNGFKIWKIKMNFRFRTCFMILKNFLQEFFSLNLNRLGENVVALCFCLLLSYIIFPYPKLMTFFAFFGWIGLPTLSQAYMALKTETYGEKNYFLVKNHIISGKREALWWISFFNYALWILPFMIGNYLLASDAYFAIFDISPLISGVLFYVMYACFRTLMTTSYHQFKLNTTY